MATLLQVLIVILSLFTCGLTPGLAAQAKEGEGRSLFPRPGPHTPGMPIITVLYDNNPHRPGLGTDWGFSCLITVGEKTVMFDAGGDGRLLLANMRKLGVVPDEVDAVVLSHQHRDHVGGVEEFLKENRQAPVYLPQSVPDALLRSIERKGAEVVRVGGPTEIFDDLFSTGELGRAPREQALVVRTRRGVVIVTGCAHPGIERVVRKAQGSFGEKVLLVLGGFHLTGSSKAEIRKVVEGLKKLGVSHVVPCHCTGAAARRLFRQAYGSGFIDAGVGKVIDTEGLR